MNPRIRRKPIEGLHNHLGCQRPHAIASDIQWALDARLRGFSVQSSPSAGCLVPIGSIEVDLLFGHQRTSHAIRVAARPSLDLSLHFAASTRNQFYTLATARQDVNIGIAEGLRWRPRRRGHRRTVPIEHEVLACFNPQRPNLILAVAYFEICLNRFLLRRPLEPATCHPKIECRSLAAGRLSGRSSSRAT